jgi:hypothetical protein
MIWHLVSILIAIITFLLSSRLIYKLTVKLYAKRILTPLELSIEHLQYSYEELTYYVNIPTNNPDILQAKKEDLILRREFSSTLFPRIKGIHIYLRTGPHQQMMIAYLPVDRYCIPLLRIFLLRNQISKEAYNRIVACKLLQKQTAQEILEEVYQQLRRANRYVS